MSSSDDSSSGALYSEGKQTRFWRESAENGWLSNFYAVPLIYDGKFFPTSEALFQYLKFVHDDASPATLRYAEKIRTAKSPTQARVLAHQKIGGGYAWRQALNPIIERSLIDGVEADPDWEENKIDCMREVLRIKFTTSPELRANLVKTGRSELVEDSPYDSFWGVGTHGSGHNMLGKLLMQLRAKLIAEDQAAARLAAVATFKRQKPKKPRVFASSSGVASAVATATLAKKRALPADDEVGPVAAARKPVKKREFATSSTLPARKPVAKRAVSTAVVETVDDDATDEDDESPIVAAAPKKKKIARKTKIIQC